MMRQTKVKMKAPMQSVTKTNANETIGCLIACTIGDNNLLLRPATHRSNPILFIANRNKQSDTKSDTKSDLIHKLAELHDSDQINVFIGSNGHEFYRQPYSETTQNLCHSDTQHTWEQLVSNKCTQFRRTSATLQNKSELIDLEAVTDIVRRTRLEAVSEDLEEVAEICRLCQNLIDSIFRKATRDVEENTIHEYMLPKIKEHIEASFVRLMFTKHTVQHRTANIPNTPSTPSIMPTVRRHSDFSNAVHQVVLAPQIIAAAVFATQLNDRMLQKDYCKNKPTVIICGRNEIQSILMLLHTF